MAQIKIPNHLSFRPAQSKILIWASPVLNCWSSPDQTYDLVHPKSELGSGLDQFRENVYISIYIFLQSVPSLCKARELKTETRFVRVNSMPQTCRDILVCT